MNTKRFSQADWLAFDKEHLWHPYSSIVDPLPVYPVVAAHGTHIVLADGSELIDGMASWWSVIHGYNHPVLNAALSQQLHQMAHVMFGGLTHQSAAELGALLLDCCPFPLHSVFFCDSGSVAVEVAIKQALQYWVALEKPQKHRLLTIRNGYHGDTFGAMAVCDPENGMHHLFAKILPQHLFAGAPQCGFDDWHEHDISSFKTLITKYHDTIAAVIIEPIVQGAGGMRIYSPMYLRRVRELCNEYQVLLIADEIATGFGRTGRLFACEHADINPDILCIGKALTGGVMSLAATLSTQHIGETLCSGEAGVFMHGPTFMANPLACSVALASVQLLLQSPWQQRVTHIQEHLKTRLDVCKTYKTVTDVRVIGAIGVVELDHAVNVAAVQKFFVNRGVWIRPFRNLIYLMPPYTIEIDELDCLIDAIIAVLVDAKV